MKKLLSVTAAFVLGVIVTLSSGEAYAQVASLIGKKVSGEVSVVVDGKTLTAKGAVIEGVTNVPVRALSDAIGADIIVEGKNVIITTQDTSSNNVVSIDGKYYTKYELLNKKTALEDKLKLLIENGEQKKAEYDKLVSEDKLEAPAVWESILKGNIDSTNNAKAELDKVNEALKKFD